MEGDSEVVLARRDDDPLGGEGGHQRSDVRGADAHEGSPLGGVAGRHNARAELREPVEQPVAERVDVRLEEGRASFSTGVRFRGARLQIDTPETRVVANRTTFSVHRGPSGTCVSVLVGEVAMEDGDGTSAVVAEGQRRCVFADSLPAETGPLDEAERARLTRFLERQRDILHE